MRREKVLPAILGFMLILLSAFVIAQTNSVGAVNGAEGVACTMDAKMCPDGSYVGRVAPNCEFATCPGENDKDRENESELDEEDDNEEEDQVVGSSCGTVTPGYNNECCVNKGYSGWDAENFRCIGETVKEGNTYTVGAHLGTADEEDENETEECEPWICSKWNACINGTQTRECTKVANCTEEEDDEDELLGSSCGTVTPGYNNECCVNKGYSGWDAENFRCIGETNNTENENENEVEAPKLSKNCNDIERIKFTNHSFECPENCTCTGSTVKCEFEGGRTMTVYAGKSGNIIVQVKGVNVSTNVTLYKADGKLYGVFKEGRTNEIILPDEAKERWQNHTHTKLYNESVNLTKDGYYQIAGHKKSRLFWLVPVREHLHADINASTGSVVKTRNPWWGFLARDVRD